MSIISSAFHTRCSSLSRIQRGDVACTSSTGSSASSLLPMPAPACMRKFHLGFDASPGARDVAFNFAGAWTAQIRQQQQQRLPSVFRRTPRRVPTLDREPGAPTLFYPCRGRCWHHPPCRLTMPTTRRAQAASQRERRNYRHAAVRGRDAGRHVPARHAQLRILCAKALAGRALAATCVVSELAAGRAGELVPVPVLTAFVHGVAGCTQVDSGACGAEGGGSGWMAVGQDSSWMCGRGSAWTWEWRARPLFGGGPPVRCGDGLVASACLVGGSSARSSRARKPR